MSLTSLLSIARSALLTHQLAMNVTAQNIANAQTQGYSRQRLDIVPFSPYRTADGLLGRGVTDQGILRARDQFFDAAFRRESGLLSRSNTLLEFLGQVEAVMNEPSDSGLGAAIDGLFQAFSDLANDPTGVVARDQARSAAMQVASRLRQLDGAVSQASQDAFTRMQSDVAEANDLAQRIAKLNVDITANGGPNIRAADLEDQRDLLIDRLSTLVGVRVLQHDDGTVGIVAGDVLLVDGGTAGTLEVRALAGGGFGVALQGAAGTFDPQAGSLEALADLTAVTLPALRADLDALAQALVTEVNTVHRSGYTLTGATNADFFDPAGVTAATIAVAPGILASTDAIAAGATPAVGDANLALQLAGLGRATIASLSGRSFRDHFTSLASGLGTLVRDATQDATAGSTLVDRAETLRSSVSGVSLDEEMVSLIAQQQAFQAAARLIRVADEMMQDLMQIL